jgi:pimeloyl-ACP methyl ester carboxylesterase
MKRWPRLQLAPRDSKQFPGEERDENYEFVLGIDAHYRTIPNRESRGLVGHSMGGYGASRIGMKHPDVFSSLYIMSPCCLIECCHIGADDSVLLDRKRVAGLNGSDYQVVEFKIAALKQIAG